MAGTHAFDMIKKLRENADLRRKDLFKMKNFYHNEAHPVNVKRPELSPEERNMLQKERMKENRWEKWSSLLITLLTFLFLIFLILFIIKFLIP